MCRDEVFGDYYRPCGHFIKSYYSGERLDCLGLYCGLSARHVHKAPNCPCPRVLSDERRIQNMFHTKCDPCKGGQVINVRRGRSLERRN